MKKDLAGIIAPINTPFVNEEVSVDYMRRNMRKYRETPLAGYLVLGSNGENKSMTEEEKLKIVEAVVEEKADHQIVMAGAGYESTRRTIAFAKEVAKLGADCASILNPFYFKKDITDEALIRFYTDVADALPIPVVVYNAPIFTGAAVSPKVIQAVSRHPNIIGMKDTSPEGAARFLECCDESFTVLAGTIDTLLAGLVLGAKGGVVAPANAYPHACCELYDTFLKGDLDEARKMHLKLYRLNNAISGTFGVAGIKYAMDVAGYYGGLPRLPLLPLNDSDKQKIRDAIEKAGL